MKIVIVTGLSGAGKTHAADWFEDHGFYCVDNMPPSLIMNFVELASLSKSKIEKAAFVVDIRGGSFFKDLSDCIVKLRNMEDVDFKILFIEASDATLIKRYNETRRNHPLTTGATTAAIIQRERESLAELRANADYIIDTTHVKVAGLNQELQRIFDNGESESNFIINIASFGYKYGIPAEADLVFDMRFIPNPYYVPSLKKLTGNNKRVAHYVMKQKVTGVFVAQLHDMINGMIPYYIKEGKYHLNIAFGCTGGQHRSVATANKMAEIFKEDGYRVTVEHRQL
ncbi:MAG: RNase adapter RapZ [Eubacteriaceae bacterium]|nr:RNase adapter RapZ [Eubacteriaceae bacterium]